MRQKISKTCFISQKVILLRPVLARNVHILLIVLSLGLISCHRSSTPRAYGYFRISTPSHQYHRLQGYPFSFDVSDHARIVEVENGFDIHYAGLNADIHCSNKVVNGNLRGLTDDAINFVYKHVQQASAIPEQEYTDEQNKVYGVYFRLQGNTASPHQFFITDSTNYFFRGAAYCYCPPNADSLAPIIDFLGEDILHLIETFRWETTR